MGEADDTGPAPWPGLLLSGTAGAVDGVGYLLVHVFTAHVTGDTVHVGARLARQDLAGAAHAAYAIAFFVAGTALGAVLRDASARRGLPGRAVVLAVALASLAAFVVVGTVAARAGALAHGVPFLVLTACAAGAMGLQNAVPPMVGGRRVRPFMTGTLTDAVEAAVRAVGAPARSGARHRAVRRGAALFAVWAVYLCGGLVAGAAAVRWGAVAALLPMAGLTATAAGEVLHPRFRSA